MEGILAKITTLKNVFSEKNLQPSYEVISALCIGLVFLVSTVTTGFSTERGSELPVQCNVGCSDTNRPDHGYNMSVINEECQKQFVTFVKHWYSLALLCFGCCVAILVPWLCWNKFPCNRIKRASCRIRELEEHLLTTGLTHEKLVSHITHPTYTWKDQVPKEAVRNIRSALFCKKTETMSPILCYTVINFVTLVIHIVMVAGGWWIYFHAWTLTCDWNNECFNCTAEDIIVRILFCLLVAVIGLGALPRIWAILLSFPLIKEHCQQLPENCTEMFRQNVQDNKLVVLFSKSASMCLSTEASDLLAVEPEEWLSKIKQTNEKIKQMKRLDLDDLHDREFIQNVLNENNYNHVSEMQSDINNETLSQPSTTPPESSETDKKEVGSGNNSKSSSESAIARQGIDSQSIFDGSTGCQNLVAPEPQADKKYAAPENGKFSERSPLLTGSSGIGV